jgi:hypothetical protein
MCQERVKQLCGWRVQTTERTRHRMMNKRAIVFWGFLVCFTLFVTTCAPRSTMEPRGYVDDAAPSLVVLSSSAVRDKDKWGDGYSLPEHLEWLWNTLSFQRRGRRNNFQISIMVEADLCANPEYIITASKNLSPCDKED